MPSLCRTCLTQFETPLAACPVCGSDAMLAHPDLARLTIAHIDCDAFFASLEKARYPALKHRPVIIGNGARGVVATACYVARVYGVRSAMPLFKARALCPDAVILKPDIAYYSSVASGIRARMRALPGALVEAVSIDEAFLDLSDTRQLAARVLAQFQQEIAERFGLTLSIGLSENKLLAKMASDMDKPQGFSLLNQREGAAYLADKPVGFLWGVGQATERKARKLGYRYVADLAEADPQDLIRQFGRLGVWLNRASKGQDSRRIRASRPSKSLSAETTFGRDLRKLDELAPHVERLCARVAQRLTDSGYTAQSVTLKLKTDAFETRTRQRQLGFLGDQDSETLARVTFGLLQREIEAEQGRQLFRLIGVAATGLTRPEQQLIPSLV